MDHFFSLASENLQKPKDKQHRLRLESYLKAYPKICRFFSNIQPFTENDFIACAHLVYGWMPTTLKLHGNSCTFKNMAELLNKARSDANLDKKDLGAMKKCINNSIVGTSKLLHFTNPEKFPIYDSKTYFFWKPLNSKHQINSVTNYLEYKEDLMRCINDKRYKPVHEKTEQFIGYEVEAMRAAELAMFLSISKKN